MADYFFYIKPIIRSGIFITSVSITGALSLLSLVFSKSPEALGTNSSMARKDTKAPTASEPTKSVGGKQKKKKWGKGKQNEKVNNMVLFDRLSYDKLLTEAPKIKLITPSILSDRFRVNGSLARKAIRELTANGLSKMVSAHTSQQIYTRATTVV